MKDINIELKDDEINLSLLRKAKEDPERGFVPAYYFDILLNDGTHIGKCDLRIGHNENTHYGGNIGYSINEEYRGHRYATRAVGLLLKLADEMGMEYIIITCDTKNRASARTCELAGGKFMGILVLPEHTEMYKTGRRNTMQFRFDIKSQGQ